MSKRGLDRRQFLGATAAGLLFPSLAISDSRGDSNKKFLFVVCVGGWDQTFFFTDGAGNTSIDGDPYGLMTTLNGISYVDSEFRPAARDFLSDYGSRTAVINGIEVRSVAHDICMSLMMCGGTHGGDDWSVKLAALANGDFLLPNLSVSGPSFSYDYQDKVVRVGESGQLASLLSGEALSLSDMAVSPPDDQVKETIDAYVMARTESLLAQAEQGRYRDALSTSLQSQQELLDLGRYSEQLDLSSGQDFTSQLGLVLDSFELGLSNTGVVACNGFQELGWDTHGANYMQNDHFNTLFKALSGLLRDIDRRQSSDGGSLADEVVVVVLSEMGRLPKLNSRLGKEHWTYTSAMLIGAGVAGGQVVGGYNSEVMGQRINTVTGEVTSSGVGLEPGHIGATLFALADIDPAEHLDDDPIEAVLS